MEKESGKKPKISKENATKEFDRIIEAFGFNVSSELKNSMTTSMKLNNVEYQYKSDQEFINADSMVQRIMQGIIFFDEEKKQIVYKLRDPITSAGKESIKEFRFGKFTRAMQLASKVPLNECNFMTMKEEQQTSLLEAMTGISDDSVFGQLEIAEFMDLRMIAGYFFN